jgi:hypothetical protein
MINSVWLALELQVQAAMACKPRSPLLQGAKERLGVRVCTDFAFRLLVSVEGETVTTWSRY